MNTVNRITSHNIGSMPQVRPRERERNDPSNLARLALSIAGDEYPGLDVDRFLSRLDDGAEVIRRRLNGNTGPIAATDAIAHYMFVDEGYYGNLDDYDDQRNSYLNEVMVRGAGTPLTLSIVFLALGWRLGLPLSGVAFPGHFLVKYEDSDGMRVLDPFFRGMEVSREQLHERLRRVTGPTTPVEALQMVLKASEPKDMIVRLLRNLKVIHRRNEDFQRLARVADRLCKMAPTAAEERRDRGFAYLALGAERAALEDFRRYLKQRPGADDAFSMGELVKELVERGVATLQ